MADDSDSKTDGAFSVRDLGIRSRGLDAPRVEALRRRGFEFDLRNIEAGRAGPAVARQRSRGYLCPLVVVDSKVPVREVALIGALDPDLYPESFANHDGRWYVPRDDIRRVRRPGVDTSGAASPSLLHPSLCEAMSEVDSLAAFVPAM